MGKYRARVEAVGSLLCVGLDSDYHRVPAIFQREAYPQYAFNCWLIEQTHPFVCAYKLNTAFYEMRGSTGWHELKLTVRYLQDHHPDIFTICDAKRADIGNTNGGYVKGIFDALNFDSVTLHPYLGQEALAPFLDRADKVSIILARTSNPGATEFQELPVNGRPLWEHVLERVCTSWNALGNCMLVIGATAPADLARARHLAGDVPFLVPGVGEQGGDAATVRRLGADSHGGGLIVNSSRAVIFAESPAREAEQLRDALRG